MAEGPIIDEPVAQTTELQPRAQGDLTPMHMLQIAVERGADVDQLAKLMDLQQRWEEAEARKAFVAAKAAFKAEEISIDRNRHVGFVSQRTGDRTDYNHATLDHVTAALGPALSKHGLSYSWETEQQNGTITVTCKLEHVLGHCERVTLQAAPDNSGNKNPIQAVGSTVTYLQRYTLLAITGTATVDQDDDGAAGGMGELISHEQLERLRALLDETGSDIPKFCQYLGIDNLTVLPAAKFDQAVAALENKKRAQAQSEKEQDDG